MQIAIYQGWIYHLASSARRSVAMPVFHGVLNEGAFNCPLQSATLLSQHCHYLRWLNLHVIYVYKVFNFYWLFITLHDCMNSCCSTVQ